jgi:hypothetical protein
MTLVVIIVACVLAAAGAALAEWLRVRRGWLPAIAPSYGTAGMVAGAIVLAQAGVNALTDGGSGHTSTWSPVQELIIVVVIGPALHGVTWLLILQAWQALRTAAMGGGRRSPRM